MFTISKEEVLQQIYLLEQNKGYVCVTDIASALHVLPSKTTRTIQKMNDLGLVHYEKYKYVALTPSGRMLAKEIIDKKKKLEDFLLFIGLEQLHAQQEASVLCQHMETMTLNRMLQFMHVVKEHPECHPSYQEFIN